MGAATRIVVLEDEKLVQRALDRMLKTANEVPQFVTYFDTIQAALTDLAERVHDGLHLSTVFLVDGKLLDGYSIGYLRELAVAGVPRHRVVLSTGSEPADDYMQYCGAALLKPFSRHDVIAVVLQAAA